MERRDIYQDSEENPKHVTVDFSTPEDVGLRIWGREILVAHEPGVYTVKLLIMNKGASGRLQHHRLKNERAFVYSGRLLFEYDSGDGKLSRRVLKAGDSVHIPPGAVHRETALRRCVIFEGSTPHFNDREGDEEKYGEEVPEGALPTTSIDEIEFR